jgi:hypothetical protein
MAPASLRLRKIAAIWIGDWGEVSGKQKAREKTPEKGEREGVLFFTFPASSHSAGRRAPFDQNLAHTVTRRGPAPNQHLIVASRSVEFKLKFDTLMSLEGGIFFRGF